MRNDKKFELSIHYSGNANGRAVLLDAVERARALDPEASMSTYGTQKNDDMIKTDFVEVNGEQILSHAG